MQRLKMDMSQLNLRSPWLWPKTYQHALFFGAGVLGVLLLSPWWLQSWQAWDEATEAQAKLMTQQTSIQALRTQTAQLMQAQNQSHNSFADVAGMHIVAEPTGCKSNFWLQTLRFDTND